MPDKTAIEAAAQTLEMDPEDLEFCLTLFKKDRLNTTEAAKLLEIHPDSLRRGLITGAIPCGCAIYNDETETWMYIVYRDSCLVFKREGKKQMIVLKGARREIPEDMLG